MVNNEINKPITQIFHNSDSAEQAYQYALSCGYSPEEISIIMSEDTRKNYYGHILSNAEDVNPKQDLSLGGAAGATIGSVIGALIAMGTNLITPGLGLIIAGPLAGAGAVAGGLMGTLFGLGVTEDKAEQYESAIKEGAIILSIQDTRESDLALEWKKIAE